MTPGLNFRCSAVLGLRSAARCACVWVLVSTANAAEATKPFAAPQASEKVVSSGGAGDLVQVTFSLLLVLGAVFAAAWMMRRLRGLTRANGGALQVIAEVALGAKERAVLVQVGKQQLLLGVTASQVNTLHVLNENVADSRPLPVPSPSHGGGDVRPDFKAILKRSLGL